MRRRAGNPAFPGIPREGRRRLDPEAKVWLAEQARADGPGHSGISVLFVGSLRDDYASLLGVLRAPDFCLFRARGIQQPLAVLRRLRIGVIIADCSRWKDLRTALEGSSERPLARVIVAAERADDGFWSEATKLGAHDVLAKPFEPEDVVTAVMDAWGQWRREIDAIAAGGVRTAARFRA